MKRNINILFLVIILISFLENSIFAQKAEIKPINEKSSNDYQRLYREAEAHVLSQTKSMGELINY